MKNGASPLSLTVTTSPAAVALAPTGTFAPAIGDSFLGSATQLTLSATTVASSAEPSEQVTPLRTVSA